MLITKTATPGRADNVTDLNAVRRRRPATDQAITQSGRDWRFNLQAAFDDDELVGDAKLLVLCWMAAFPAISGYDGTVLEAVRVATGLRDHAALQWLATVVLTDSHREGASALPRYIDADWSRFYRWAERYLATTDGEPVPFDAGRLGRRCRGVDR
jgi:hypothetical protein